MSLQVLIHVCCVMLAASRYQLLLCEYFDDNCSIKKREIFFFNHEPSKLNVLSLTPRVLQNN